MQRGLLLTSSGGFRLLDRTSDMVFGLNREPAFERRMQPVDIHGLQEIHIYADRLPRPSWRHKGEGSQVGARG